MSETETKPTPSLDLALLRAQQRIVSVAKSDTNTFHKYKYASSEDMVAECRQALHAEGLTVTGLNTVVDTMEYDIINKGGREEDGTPVPAGVIRHLVVIITRTMVLTHAPSQEERRYEIDFPAIPEKGRPLDKAVAGALTTSLSYFLRDLLLVPRGDENEMDRREPEPAPKQAQRPVQPQKQGGPPKSPARVSAEAEALAWVGRPEKVVAVLKQVLKTLMGDQLEGKTLADINDAEWKQAALFISSTRMGEGGTAGISYNDWIGEPEVAA